MLTLSQKDSAFYINTHFNENKKIQKGRVNQLY